jgi:hypothetical protein
LAKGNRRRTGRMAEQSYEPILPVKVGNRRARAVTLVVVPAGENPVGGDYPVATVVIPGGGEGDRTVESPEVKVSVREASNSAGRSNGEPISPEIFRRGECRTVGALGEGKCLPRRNWVHAAADSPGTQGTTCWEGTCSESAELLAGRLGAPAQRGHRI